MKAPLEEKPGTRELKARARPVGEQGARPVGAVPVSERSRRRNRGGYRSSASRPQTRSAAKDRREECRCAVRGGGSGTARRRGKRPGRDDSCCGTRGGCSPAGTVRSRTGAGLAAARAYVHAERANLWREPRRRLGAHRRDRTRSGQRQSHPGRFGRRGHLGVARPRRHMGPAHGFRADSDHRRHRLRPDGAGDRVLWHRRRNWWARLGAGVLRSTDSGTTWTTIATAPFVGTGFYDLIIDRANRNHLLAGTTNGLFESVNAGVTWTARRNRRTWDLSMTPAGELPRRSSLRATMVSSDPPTAARRGLRPALPGRRRRSKGSRWLMRAPIRPSHTPSARAGRRVRLWRRNAVGTWAAVAPPAGLTTAQAWYDWFLEVAPNTDARIYIAGIEVFRGELSRTTWTWTNITNKGAAGDSIHPDQHALAFDPVDPNMIYVGNDGGLYRSPNLGTNWTALNRGLAITEIEYVDHDLGSSRYLIGGTQDNGSIRYLGSAVWGHAQDGDGGDCGVGTRSTPIPFSTPSSAWGWSEAPRRVTSVRGDGSGRTFRPGSRRSSIRRWRRMEPRWHRPGRASMCQETTARTGPPSRCRRDALQRDGDADGRPGAGGVHERTHLPADVDGSRMVGARRARDAAGRRLDQRSELPALEHQPDLGNVDVDRRRPRLAFRRRRHHVDGPLDRAAGPAINGVEVPRGT